MEMSNQRLDVALAIAILLAVFFPILHVGAAQVPNEAYISGVVGHAQGYSLSCESRSAADWAAYWGVYIDETEFLNALPRSDDPNQGFVGNPNHTWGATPPNAYGVHAAPVAELLRGYGLEAEAIYGMSWDQARLEVSEGRPVIVWVIGSVWSGSSKSYSTEAGDEVTVANYEHTMILIGYNDEVVHLVDALTGNTVSHSIDNFLESWSVLGNMAVTGKGAERADASVDTYAVQPGDTLRRLAAQWGVSWQAIADWNDLAYPYTIYSGQLLYTGPLAQPEVQPSTTEVYYVQEGEHLMQIAQDLDMDWQYLADINGLQPPYALAVGQALQLSAGEESSDGAAEASIEVPEYYTAWRVESLVSIAEYYDLNWVEMASMNGIGFPYLVQPGQTLRLIP